MKEFFSQNGGIVAVVSMIALMLNVFLSGLSKALEIIKDKTATEVDNKAYAFIQKIAVVLQKIVDWSSGNRQH